MSTYAMESKAVHVDRIFASYRDIVALKNVSFTLKAGEILALLGPSGCGKTTLLRSIAGFVPHSGDIFIGEERVTNVSPHRRNIGMVFQDYALFPHMTVAENVAFGLRMRGVSRKTAVAQISETLALVGLKGFNERMPFNLSGGQQQRVALARALVIKPTVLLLDEPLSALDKKLREEMRVELKRIQRATGVTTIFVTHDQDEALALADHLALMYRGELVQWGTPEDVYRRPDDSFVAEFLGAANSGRAICQDITSDSALLKVPGLGILRSSSAPGRIVVGRRAKFYIRPERTRLSLRAASSAETGLPATITARTYLGRHFEFSLLLADGSLWTAHVADEQMPSEFAIGAAVIINADPHHVIVFDDDEGAEKS
jgi:ABC-type Fe3+/spermidine/putrescine transport system ATPase subunit